MTSSQLHAEEKKSHHRCSVLHLNWCDLLPEDATSHLLSPFVEERHFITAFLFPTSPLCGRHSRTSINRSIKKNPSVSWYLRFLLMKHSRQESVTCLLVRIFLQPDLPSLTFHLSVPSGTRLATPWTGSPVDHSSDSATEQTILINSLLRAETGVPGGNPHEDNAVIDRCSPVLPPSRDIFMSTSGTCINIVDRLKAHTDALCVRVKTRGWESFSKRTWEF